MVALGFGVTNVRQMTSHLLLTHGSNQILAPSLFLTSLTWSRESEETFKLSRLSHISL